MNDAELEALAADISTNGCRVPVSICDDLILDGRNRALACERAGVPVPWETLPAVGARDASPAVTSLNLQRRHMDESQRALAAAKLANLGAGRPSAAGTAEPAAEADETAVSGTGRLVRPNGDGAPIGAVSPKAAAELMRVSRRSTQGAAAIKNDPDLALAVERGHVTVADAYRSGTNPPRSRFAIWVESRVSRAAISVRTSSRPAVN